MQRAKDIWNAVNAPRFTLVCQYGLIILDASLTWFIIHRIPFTNVDWETYIEQADVVLAGGFDYAQIRGATGPIAYPAGHCYFFGLLRLLGAGVRASQVIFAGIYLVMMWAVFEIYRHAGAPAWIMALCVLSKRVHSIFVLRLFNDGISQCLLFVAVLCFMKRRHVGGSVLYSLAVSVKMQPLLMCPAIGLHLVLSGGWSHALGHIGVMLSVQALLAAPFLWASPGSYLAQSFGGPGDLQHAWSVNWRCLPSEVFFHPGFPCVLLAMHAALLLWFAQYRWTPPKGLLDARIWAWRGRTEVNPAQLANFLFSCNFVGILCLRTMHFQFLVWYFHMVPLLAWHALKPERCSASVWLLRTAAVAMLTLFVEVPFLLTGSGTVRGPDGRQWETDGVPTRLGSQLLFLAHIVLLLLLARQGRYDGFRRFAE